MKLDRFDVLVIAGTVIGALGFGLVYLPLAFVFIAAVCLTLAAIIDHRSADNGDST
jgi:hypothetical protein